ncbi:hypothetical protein [Segatella albensis]|jgi:hypothetical protein|uniref:hypothetical protein n=1 Tax=Segatella albensis TaxID=77768 RepID=UPI0003F528FA|nr:hypothetical protein [Segatella albensis]
MNYFKIADLNIAIDFVDSTVNSIGLIPSTEPFRIEKPEGDMLFQLTVDDRVKPVKEELEKIGSFDTGNGDIIVDRLTNGGYQYIIKDINEYPCCLLITDEQFKNCKCALNGNTANRRFGLNNALMLIFAFASSYKDTLLIHASLVRNQGYGYAFIAKSGTGKSTHTGLWMKYIEGCDLMNDDNPIIRFIDEKPWIYGSPWSGKTPCYRNVKAPLGAITRIDRAKNNSIELLGPIEAFASILPSCSHMKWDHNIHNKICDTITRVIETTNIYTLHCLPNEEAARICHKTISKK